MRQSDGVLGLDGLIGVLGAIKLLPATPAGANCVSLVHGEVQGDIGHEGRWMGGNVWRGWEGAKLGYEHTSWLRVRKLARVTLLCALV